MINSVSKMNLGCTLGGVRTNIICYADDVCCLAPSESALQSIINVVSNELNDIRLQVNVKKCAFMLFSKNYYNFNHNLRLNNELIDRVSQFKYLGVILSDRMIISDDIDRVMSTFLKQFNSMYYKFYEQNNDVLHFLFRTYTSSFYGIELWYDSLFNRNINKLSICYHKAIKRVARLNVWDSNHEACDIVQVMTFQHLLAKRVLVFLFNMIKSKSPCLKPYKNYLIVRSNLIGSFNRYFAAKYDISKVLDNPLPANISRIKYVQIHEPRRR